MIMINPKLVFSIINKLAFLFNNHLMYELRYNAQHQTTQKLR